MQGNRLAIQMAVAFFRTLLIAGLLLPERFLKDERGFSAGMVTVFAFASATPAVIGLVVGDELPIAKDVDVSPPSAFPSAAPCSPPRLVVRSADVDDRHRRRHRGRHRLSAPLPSIALNSSPPADGDERPF